MAIATCAREAAEGVGRPVRFAVSSEGSLEGSSLGLRGSLQAHTPHEGDGCVILFPSSNSSGSK